VLIMGQGDYSTLADAREGAESEFYSLQLNGLPVPEMKGIATFIFQTNSSYTNSVKSRLVSNAAGDPFIDWRTDAGGTTSVSWGDILGTLSNQTDLQAALDAKPDISAAETISGAWEFSDELSFKYGEVTEGYTVAALPTPAVGMVARVTDASAPSIGSTVAGSGAAAALVWYNGSDWTIIGV
jgi:hypothetical protein